MINTVKDLIGNVPNSPKTSFIGGVLVVFSGYLMVRMELKS